MEWIWMDIRLRSGSILTAKDMIWELRKRGWRLKQLAFELGVHYNSITEFGSGRSEPKYSVGKKLEELMDRPVLERAPMIRLRRIA